jgi:hypothetical protein
MSVYKICVEKSKYIGGKRERKEAVLFYDRKVLLSVRCSTSDCATQNQTICNHKKCVLHSFVL